MAEDIIKIAEYKLKKGEISPIVLPDPTQNDPYAQVKYIFEWMASLYQKRSSATNYRHTALGQYLRYLEACNDYRGDGADIKFRLDERWDDYCLVRYKTWFDDNNIEGEDGYLSPTTIPGVFSAIRMTIRLAKKEGIAATQGFVDVSTPGSGGRTTLTHEAFLEDEFNSIFSAVKKATSFVERVAAGYTMTGYGTDPRSYAGGWKVEDNMRWYFEHEMQGIAFSNDKEMKASGLHQSFFREATSTHGGLKSLYKKWGVERMVSSRLITPLLLRLAMETGLNAESLISLKRDCFIEKHPLTGMPSLRYWKTRGQGGQELHLALLSDPGTTDIQLKLKQARVIQKTINLILKITEPLVEKVDEHLRKDLFLYESDSTRQFGAVKSLSEAFSATLEKFLSRFSREYLNDEIKLNLARFRPTLFTKLVNSGVDVLTIKDIAFHSSVLTTLRYLSAHNINKKAREEINVALDTIYQSAVSDEAKLPYATEETAFKGIQVKFRGLVADCKNVLNPPEKARKLKGYTEGSPCHFFNMCIECENILVTKESLPRLAAYRLSLIASLEAQYQTPNKERMLKYLTILDEIFDPERSEFDQKDIEWAQEMAQFDNRIYDVQTAIGVA